MKVKQLQEFLEALVAKNVQLSVMIWGPPGVGKSSVVAQVAKKSIVYNRLTSIAVPHFKDWSQINSDERASHRKETISFNITNAHVQTHDPRIPFKV